MILFVFISQLWNKMGFAQANLKRLPSSPSFIQGDRRFERDCYKHTISIPTTTGIGFPRQTEHSYFFCAS